LSTPLSDERRDMLLLELRHGDLAISNMDMEAKLQFLQQVVQAQQQLNGATANAVGVLSASTSANTAITSDDSTSHPHAPGKPHHPSTCPVCQQAMMGASSEPSKSSTAVEPSKVTTVAPVK